MDLLDLSNTSNCSSGPVPAKKCRSSDDSGCDNDWQQLLVSGHHVQSGDLVSRTLGLDHPLPDTAPLTLATDNAEVNIGSPLFQYIPSILWSLHLLYQESKLDSSLHQCLPHLACLLSQVLTNHSSVFNTNNQSETNANIIFCFSLPMIFSFPTISISTGKISQTQSRLQQQLLSECLSCHQLLCPSCHQLLT